MCVVLFACLCAVGGNSDDGTTAAAAAATVGTIVTARSLDAEQCSSYNLTLQATDGSNTAYTQVQCLSVCLRVRGGTVRWCGGEDVVDHVEK